ncbi:MAG: type II toxin-antitoxin system HicA family toxin [Syntrophobacteraceae bacterium]
MTSIPDLSFNRLISAVEQLGFIRVRQRGSHIRFVHADGRRTTIPDHGQRSVPKGLLHKIVRDDLGMTLSEFLQLFQ